MKANFNNEELAKREIESGYLSYRTLAERVGDMVLCNSMKSRLYSTMELEHGEMYNYYNEEGESITYDEYVVLEEQGENVHEGHIDFYQWYIISGSGASFLEHCNENYGACETVFYDEELDVYVWAIDHWGTSWDYVFTNIEVDKEQ